MLRCIERPVYVSLYLFIAWNGRVPIQLLSASTMSCAYEGHFDVRSGPIRDFIGHRSTPHSVLEVIRCIHALETRRWNF